MTVVSTYPLSFSCSDLLVQTSQCSRTQCSRKSSLHKKCRLPNTQVHKAGFRSHLRAKSYSFLPGANSVLSRMLLLKSKGNIVFIQKSPTHFGRKRISSLIRDGFQHDRALTTVQPLRTALGSPGIRLENRDKFHGGAFHSLHPPVGARSQKPSAHPHDQASADPLDRAAASTHTAELRLAIASLPPRAGQRRGCEGGR